MLVVFSSYRNNRLTLTTDIILACMIIILSCHNDKGMTNIIGMLFSRQCLYQALLNTACLPMIAGNHITVYTLYHLNSASNLVVPPTTLLSETARLPGQVCRVPTIHTQILRHTKMGCSALQFSHSGRLLAAGCADHDVYPLIIYEVHPSVLNLAFVHQIIHGCLYTLWLRFQVSSMLL